MVMVNGQAIQRENNQTNSIPTFPPTVQEENRRHLEDLRRKHDPKSFEPVTWREHNSCVRNAMFSFKTNAEIAAEKGSRVVRLGLNPDKESNQALITSEEARDEAYAFILREYGILPDRVAFGTATRVTQGGTQRQMWMDVDFG